ncbi:MAG: hypothetical protein AAB633_02485 [Patescibacteria group bacterium]
MVEGLSVPEQVFEPIENPRKEELRAKMKLLDDARSRILFDAGQRVLTKQEKKAIMKWMKAGGKEETWPLDDNITRENYRERLAPYGVVDLVDPNHITGRNDIYNLVNRQYVTLLQELEQLNREPQRFRPVGGAPPVAVAPVVAPVTAARETAPVEPSPVKLPAAEQPVEHPEPAVVELDEFDEEKNLQNARSWKVWEMLFAMLHAMQKHPEQFEELRDKSPEELTAKLRDEGPRLLQEYIRVATRGEMAWDNERQLWDVLDQGKLTNMDVKVGLLVLKRAGFKVELSPDHLQLVPPGTEAAAHPFVLQFDTADTDKRKQLEAAAAAKREAVPALHIESAHSPDTNLASGEYRITVDHHTDDPRERKTSGAQLLYDYFLAAGLGDFANHRRDPALERLLAFTNAHDNGEFPPRRDFYLRSAATLWGVAGDSRVSAAVLYRIMERGRNPEDALLEEDLNETIDEGKTVRDLVVKKKWQTERDAREFDFWRKQGYVIETDYGPLFVSVQTPGRYMPKQITAKAYGGVPNVLIWTPEKHSFFLAIGGGKSFSEDIKFPQEGTEVVRRSLAIFKRQVRTPQELTATLTEILWPLSPRTPRHIGGDLWAYMQNIVGPETTHPTLFSIFTNVPEKRDAVIAEFARRRNSLPELKRAIAETKDETKNTYQEIFDLVQRTLQPRPHSEPPPPAPAPSSEPEPPPPPAAVEKTEEADATRAASELAADYQKTKEAAFAAKKRKQQLLREKKRQKGAGLKSGEGGEDSEG